MLYCILFPKADVPTVNTKQKVRAPRWPVRQLQFVVYLHNFMIV